MISCQRDLFNIPENISYFNCAYISPQLIESKKALIEGANLKSVPWEWTSEKFFSQVEEIRVLCADLFGKKPDNYALAPSVSYGMNTAARAIEPKLKKGDQILLIDEDFPSNVLTWRRVCKEVGSTILTVSKDENSDWTSAIINHINSKVKAVSISSCHWTNGEYIDLELVSKKCKENGCFFIIDATQSLAVSEHSIKKINPDFLIAAAYKWMLCPYGLAIIYVSDKWFNSRPLEETWLARDNAKNFSQLVNYSDKYMPGARKFDMGQTAMPTLLPGSIVALKQIKKWGIKNISKTLESINNKISNELVSFGFDIFPQNRRVSHILGVRIPKGKNKDYVSNLRSENIYISQRGSSLRIAPYLHINNRDIARLLKFLSK
ncbi:MAG: aminotransferase class V-fold PLP-dependent enzyme [Flavobacteriaceae bacterium]|jgi:selenocysteine lyase/cysteine desulfurase|nr:aminotransferase class V-fold PLP-dependent enzyme [Flavobacteriaceae bacterium]